MPERKIDPVSVTFYSWAAPYFVNSDASGLSGEEKAEADAFTEEVFKRTGRSFCLDAGTGCWFGKPEIDGCGTKYPAGDITEFIFARWIGGTI